MGMSKGVIAGLAAGGVALGAGVTAVIKKLTSKRKAKRGEQPKEITLNGNNVNVEEMIEMVETERKCLEKTKEDLDRLFERTSEAIEELKSMQTEPELIEVEEIKDDQNK